MMNLNFDFGSRTWEKRLSIHSTEQNVDHVEMRIDDDSIQPVNLHQPASKGECACLSSLTAGYSGMLVHSPRRPK
eukprot:scaffold1828_cov169-Amphora_coffeaeformis.AAC.20